MTLRAVVEPQTFWVSLPLSVHLVVSERLYSDTGPYVGRSILFQAYYQRKHIAPLALLESVVSP